MKRVIVYCRESRDDNEEFIDRIETQRDILLSFCKRKGLTNIIDIVMDNNVSGTKFERLDDIKQKVISHSVDVLVFKDASRLGRNLLESLKFVELAQENNVEVLFESEKYNEEFFPLLAWFNEQRAREDSVKIRRVMKHKMESGELIVKPIYGYKKKDNQLIIDEEVAPIIRSIYDMYIDGKGTRQIASILNNKGILTPSQYGKMPNVSNIWIQQQVYRILNNPVYYGEMVYRRMQKKNFKSKGATPTPKDQQIVVENHHEPIITKEMFDAVQKIKSHYKKKTTKIQSLFSGLIECGRCGRPLIFRRRKTLESYYECIKYNQEGALKYSDFKGEYGCTTHRLFEDDVKKSLREHIDMAIDEKQKDRFDQSSELYNKQKRNPKNIIEQYKREIQKAEKIIEQIYDDRLNGIINEKLYQKKCNDYNEKIDILKSEIVDMEDYLSNKELNQKSLEELREKLKTDTINNIDLKRAFRRIIYFKPQEITMTHKEKHLIDDEVYAQTLKNGGLLFLGR